MSPTIVLDSSSGKPVYVAGSPGGSRIIGYTAKTLMLLMDFGLDPQQSINIPHFQNRNGPTELEPSKPGITTEYDSEALTEALTLLNHSVTELGGEGSGLGAIELMKDGSFLGGADLRREGTAGGRAASPTVAPSPTAPPVSAAMTPPSPTSTGVSHATPHLVAIFSLATILLAAFLV